MNNAPDNPIPSSAEQFPQAGGSYRRDPITGALTRIPPEPPAAPAGPTTDTPPED
jgi:hypothetical protein